MTFAERFSTLHREIYSGPGDDFHEQRDSGRDKLLLLIDELKESGHLLGAGMIARQSAWIFLGDLAGMSQFGELAYGIYERVLRDSSDPLTIVIAHLELAFLLRESGFPASAGSVEQQAIGVFHRRSAAEALIQNYRSIPEKNSYLISGFRVFTDYAGQWDVVIADYEIDKSITTWIGAGMTFPVPGAFQLLVTTQDYERALEVADIAPDGFKYPGVCGWREVCRASLEREEPSKYYLKAAEYFASDTPPEKGVTEGKPFWSAYHQMTLAPYYRARAALSISHSNPNAVVEAIRLASEEIDLNQSGFFHGPARKLAILVHGLGSFIKTKDESALDKLASNYRKEIELWGHYAEDDHVLLEGLDLVARSIEGFRYNPEKEIQTKRLAEGIQRLESIPEWSQLQFASYLGNNLGKSVLEVSQGSTYSDVGLDLQKITTEKDLQNLVLRLLQAQGPYHAKITHGPIEHGKDVMAIVENNGDRQLHIYVVKVGDVGAQKWNTIKESIDQAFTVLPTNTQVTQYKPASTHVCLVFNGHFNPYIDPVADGWFRELRTERNWDIKVLNLEGLSKWIVSNRLVSVFNKFIRELSNEK